MEAIKFSHTMLKAKGFNDKQIREIDAGLELGLDVSIYADTAFDKDQMYQIRRGLEEGVNVTSYADPRYPFDRMSDMRNRLYANKGKIENVRKKPDLQTMIDGGISSI